MSRIRIAFHGTFAGMFGGAMAGLADAIATPHVFLGRRFLATAVLDWTLVGLACGILAGIAAALLLRPNVSRGPRAESVLLASLTVAAVVLPAAFLVFVSLNVTVLGGDTEPLTLAVDAAVLLAAAGVAFAGVRLLAPRLARPNAGFARLVTAPAALLGIPAFAIAAVAMTWRGGESAVGPPSATPPSGPETPHVILVLLDTLEAGRLSCAGNPRPTSPWIDRLARRGVMFASCTSQSCYTKPSVASLLTSLPPSAHRVGHLRTVLAPSLVTLPEAFHEAGWRTSMIVSNTILGAEFGFAQGAELFRTLPTDEIGRTRLGYALRRLGEERRVPPFGAVANGLRWVERKVFGTPDGRTLHLSAADVEDAFRARRRAVGGAPSFDYLHYMEPHAPYRPPRFDGERFLAPGDELLAEHPSTVGLFLPFERADTLSAAEHRGLLAAYEGEIAALDRQVGRLLEEFLEAERPTVVAITSDHGEEFGEHGGWGHGQSLYEEQLRIPCVFVGEGIPSGEVSPAPARLIDIAPTLLALAGVEAPTSMSGRSFAPEFGVGGTIPPAPVEILSEIQYSDTYWARALKAGSAKLLVARLGDREAVELYDLANDPRELHDRSALEPQVVAALRGRLEELVVAPGAAVSADSTLEFDPVTIERLRALGYVR